MASKVRIRVKTEKELGGRPPSWNENGKMDYLFGKEVEAEYDGRIFKVKNKGAYLPGAHLTWTLRTEEVEIISRDLPFVVTDKKILKAFRKVSKAKLILKAAMTTGRPEEQIEGYAKVFRKKDLKAWRLIRSTYPEVGDKIIAYDEDTRILRERKY